MIEIKAKNQQIESIESRGEVMTAEEQRMKEERIAISRQKIIKSGYSGKYDKTSNFPKKEKSDESNGEIDAREEQYNKQNRELERRERF